MIATCPTLVSGILFFSVGSGIRFFLGHKRFGQDLAEFRESVLHLSGVFTAIMTVPVIPALVLEITAFWKCFCEGAKNAECGIFDIAST